MQLAVTREVLEFIEREAGLALPDECCGILTGNGRSVTGAIAARNVHASPANHFELEPQALIDAHRAARSGGPAVLGYYHSHPNGLARPSKIDQAEAFGDGKIWAVIAKSEVTFWLDDPVGFSALSYSATDG